MGKAPDIHAECYCGWRMTLLSKQGFNDAGHLHYASEGLTPVVYVLPTDENAEPWSWAQANLEHIVYDGGKHGRDMKVAI